MKPACPLVSGHASSRDTVPELRVATTVLSPEQAADRVVDKLRELKLFDA